MFASLCVACATETPLDRSNSLGAAGGPSLNEGTAGTSNAAGSGTGATGATGTGATGATGTGATGGSPGTCDPQFKTQMGVPACDSCLLSSCCEALVGCDYGTPCELLQQCVNQNCATATDFLACSNQNCSTYMTTEATTAWDVRAECITGSCASQCGVDTGGNCNVQDTTQIGLASCDQCLQDQCCSVYQACDAGTECGLLQVCANTSCQGVANDQFQACLEQSCSLYLTSGAVAGWNARSDCMNTTCLSSCQ